MHVWEKYINFASINLIITFKGDITMETIFSHNVDDQLIDRVEAQLYERKSVKVINTHETVYGWGFDKELEEFLAGDDCTIKCVANDLFEGFPKEFIISPYKQK